MPTARVYPRSVSAVTDTGSSRPPVLRESSARGVWAGVERERPRVSRSTAGRRPVSGRPSSSGGGRLGTPVPSKVYGVIPVPARPVLKHGPRSPTLVRAAGFSLNPTAQ